jgi:DNA-binding transcriptional LysR family regulator
VLDALAEFDQPDQIGAVSGGAGEALLSRKRDHEPAGSFVLVASGKGRVPFGDEAGLRVAALSTEPRVVVLPAGHRLAGKEEVTEADLTGGPLVWHADPSTQPTRRPHPNAGYLVRGVDETLEQVAAGRGLSFLTRSGTAGGDPPRNGRAGS